MKKLNVKKLSVLLLVAFVSGCGGDSINPITDTTTSQFSPPTGGDSSGSGGDTGGGGSDDPPDDFDDTDPKFDFTISGKGTITTPGDYPEFSMLDIDPENPPLIYTDSILKVKLEVEKAAPLSVEGIPFTAIATCWSMTVVARSYDVDAGEPTSTYYPQTSGKLAATQNLEACVHPTTGQVYTESSTKIFDFSILAQPGNPYPFFFEVKDASYNWKCLMYSLYTWWVPEFAFSCAGDAMVPLHYSHQVSGSIQIKSNEFPGT